MSSDQSLLGSESSCDFTWCPPVFSPSLTLVVWLRQLDEVKTSVTMCRCENLQRDYSRLMKQETPLLITPSTCLICTDENSCPPPSFCSNLHPSAEEPAGGGWMLGSAEDAFVSQGRPQLAPCVCLKLLDEENELKLKPVPVIPS